MGGKSGGSSGPSVAEMEAHDAKLREQWAADYEVQETERREYEEAQRAEAEQGRRDDLWKTAISDYDKVYDYYKKQFDVDAELASRQGASGFTGSDILKGADATQNEIAQAPEKTLFEYTGQQSEIDAINKEMDRLQGIEFNSFKNVGSSVKGDTMKKFERKPADGSIGGLTSTDEEDEFKLSKGLGGY